MSLYVTYSENNNKSVNPVICIFISTSSLSGFLRIHSIIKITIFPPSNAGIGNKFVTPNDTEIKLIR